LLLPLTALPHDRAPYYMIVYSSTGRKHSGLASRLADIGLCGLPDRGAASPAGLGAMRGLGWPARDMQKDKESRHPADAPIAMIANPGIGAAGSPCGAPPAGVSR